LHTPDSSSMSEAETWTQNRNGWIVCFI